MCVSVVSVYKPVELCALAVVQHHVRSMRMQDDMVQHYIKEESTCSRTSALRVNFCSNVALLLWVLGSPWDLDCLELIKRIHTALTM